MSDTEVVYLFGGAAAFWTPISLFLMSLIGMTMFGIAMGFGLALLTLVVLSSQLTNLKRKLPDGLHVIWLKKQAQTRYKLFNFGYIDRSGAWDIRRTYKVKKANYTENEDTD